MLDILIIALCLLLNGLLAAAEIAFVAVHRPYLRELVRQGHGRASLLLQLREKPERTLSVVQIGITLVGALAGAVGGAGAEELLSPGLEAHLGLSEGSADTLAIGLVVLPLTYATVVIGELVPKSLALRNAVGFALRSARWLSLFDRLLGPIVTLFEWSTRQVLRVIGLFHRLTGTSPSGSKEVKNDGEGSGIALDRLSEPHRQYVMNLVGLERRTLNEIYVPWEHVVCVRSSQSSEEVEAVILSSGHTRIPVVEGLAVEGILHTKEFMGLRRSGMDHWTSLLRPAIKLQAEVRMIAGLRLLQEHRMHMAVVYAGETLLGIVTVEDILEEIVGDLYDEDDDGRLRRILTTTPRAIVRQRSKSG
ncbi:MAG: hypothetical protein A4E19_14005 [Nitrospira sp. SG-bin1]|nr:MAG: hypothetical protein A4E19_14005 [Nitrospira sp. SG-bin1]